MLLQKIYYIAEMVVGAAVIISIVLWRLNYVRTLICFEDQCKMSVRKGKTGILKLSAPTQVSGNLF